MPVFYIISGLFFSDNKPFGLFVGYKAKRLFVPYFAFAVLHLLLYACFTQAEDIRAMVYGWANQIIKTPSSGGILIAGALWFLPALFWMNIIYYCIFRVSRRNTIISACLSVIIGLAGMWITSKKGIHLPMALDTALAGVGFMGIGHLIGSMSDQMIIDKVFYTHHVLFDFSCLAIFSWLIMTFPYVNYRSGQFGNLIAAFVLPVVMTFSFLNIIRKLLCSKSNMVNESENGGGSIASIVGKIGKNSIVYVCLNQLVITIVRPSVASIFDGYLWLQRVGILVATMFVCGVFMEILYNTKLKKILGI